jgi:2-polyprenyl-3-methyl-5-hydroxy-6-metoxy-1,4-benzoquinol methylase
MLKIAKKIFKKIFYRPIDIKKTWIDEPSQHSGMVSFLNWFDATSSIEETQKKSISDWERLIVNFPEYAKLTKNDCLEIGFGGGRLLVPAGRDFKNICGLDIHNSFEKTSEYLKLNSVNNCKLLHREDLKKVGDNSFDFIFSFIVFQHFDSSQEVNYYLSEIKRLLKPGGFCHIFYAKTQEEKIIEVDPKLFEKRRCSLFLKPEYFRDLIKKDFKICSFSDMLPKYSEKPLSKDNEGAQASILFQLK